MSVGRELLARLVVHALLVDARPIKLEERVQPVSLAPRHAREQAAQLTFARLQHDVFRVLVDLLVARVDDGLLGSRKALGVRGDQVHERRAVGRLHAGHGARCQLRHVLRLPARQDGA